MTPPPSIDQLLEYRPFVSSLAARLTSDPTLADDIQQQAWVSALEKPPRHGGALKAWFTRVVRNAAINATVAQRRRRDHESLASEGESTSEPNHELLDVRAALGEALRSLPQPYAEIIGLRFYEELSVAEIAARTQMPEVTVRTRLRRGLERMRATLDRRYGGDRDRWALGLGLLADSTAESHVAHSATRQLASTTSVATIGAVVGLGLAVAFLLGANEGVPRPGTSSATNEIVAGDDFAATAGTDATNELAAPESPAPATSGRGALRVSAAWSDGNPAEGLGLWLAPAGADTDNGRTAVLGPDGRAQWAELPTGAWELFTTANETRSIAIDDGRTAELTLLLGEPRPLLVDCVTVGPDRAGITTLLSVPGDTERWIPMAASDATGRTRLFHFDPTSWLQCRRGRADSNPVALDHPRLTRGVDPILRTRFESVRKPLHVTVLDPLGAPIAGAEVRLRSAAHHLALRDTYGMRSLDRIGRVQSGADGTCELTANRLGALQLEVAHESFAPSFQPIYDTRAPVVVQLEAGTTIAGTLHDPAGAPTSGVVRWEHAGRKNEVRADADGRYELPLFAAGTYSVCALAEAGATGLRAAVRLDLSGEPSIEWSPTLAPGARAHGTVRDSAHRPLEGLWVALEDGLPVAATSELGNDPARYRWTRTDSEGRYSFAEWREERAIHDGRTLYVFAERGPTEIPLAAAHDVGFGARVDVVATKSRARLEVRMQASVRKPSFALVATSRDCPFTVVGERQESIWVFDGLMPGRWTVRESSETAWATAIAEVELLPDQLEVVSVPAAPPLGRASIQVVDSYGQPFVAHHVELIGRGDARVVANAQRKRPHPSVWFEPDGTIRAEAPPGEYALIVRKSRLVGSTVLVIRPDGEEHASVTMHSQTQSMRVEVPEAPAGSSYELWIDYHAPDGTLRAIEFAKIRSSINFNHALPGGELIARARIEAGGVLLGRAEAALTPERSTSTLVELLFVR